MRSAAIESWDRAVAFGDPFPVSAEDARAALLLALTADRSMREGRPVAPAELERA